MGKKFSTMLFPALLCIDEQTEKVLSKSKRVCSKNEAFVICLTWISPCVMVRNTSVEYCNAGIWNFKHLVHYLN